ncbi:MAG: sigma-70 family RNA polymerase sigma factor [Gammaproteobacteria bacterium]|nr:sigma-70 family RNA polymerase sigma factor [Gammaproteobacteria bacterium]
MQITTDKTRQFEILVNALSPELFRYAYGLCRNRCLAEDLVQETFLRAWRARDDLRDRHAARSWLYTILKREFLRHIQRQRPAAVDPNEFDAIAPTDYDTSTEAFVLRRALATLSLEYREPLLLQVIGGFSCEDIAHILDLSPNAVMTRLSRARRKLRETLTGDARACNNKGTSQ